MSSFLNNNENYITASEKPLSFVKALKNFTMNKSSQNLRNLLSSHVSLIFIKPENGLSNLAKVDKLHNKRSTKYKLAGTE